MQSGGRDYRNMANGTEILTDPGRLGELCTRLRRAPFVCVDTEFLREFTYWPVLCLVQLGGPDAASGDAHLIDPLAEGMDLAPLFALLADPKVVKVFHSGGQDIEIFHHLAGVIPQPLFDTQIAASVCGFGEQVSYESLVHSLTGNRPDKGARRTDWRRRPLDVRQASYALHDVLHLPAVYRQLKKQLQTRGRGEWIREELDALTDPARYDADPQLAWKRVKLGKGSGATRAVVVELAAWREREARRRNVLRRNVMSDDALREIAALRPASVDELRSLRLFARRRNRKEETLTAIVEAVARGVAMPVGKQPELSTRPSLTDPQAALATLLKLLLRALAADAGVAEGVVASAADLERLASEEEPDIPLLKGWRMAEFGGELMRLRRGETALTVRGGRVAPVPV